VRALALALCLLAPAAHAVETGTAMRSEIRLLDKITGEVRDLTFGRGETQVFGLLSVTVGECRYPLANPSGDAFVQIEISDSRVAAPVFQGWMVASAPALHALDHARYDVWALRCITS